MMGRSPICTIERKVMEKRPHEKSVFWRTLDDEKTPGFTVFAWGSLGFGFFAFFSQVGYSLIRAVLVWTLVALAAYLMGCLWNTVAYAIDEVRYRPKEDE